MTKVSTRIEWVAARDGIGHAHRPDHGRTLCGQYVIAEQLAWPERVRCLECSMIATAELEATPRGTGGTR